MIEIVFVFFAGPEKLEAAAQAFRVTDPEGEVLFHADKNQVVVGAEELKVTGTRTYFSA